jgi:beta-lactamase class A
MNLIRKIPLAPLLLLSVVLNVVMLIPRTRSADATAVIDQRWMQVPFLARRTLSGSTNDPLINFVPLRLRIERYASEQKTRTGVFFQYLPTGITIGYNATTPFVSASLLKVPTAMKVYKLIEEGRVSKNQILRIRQQDMDTGYGLLWKRGEGGAVTVEEALSLSLVASDNTAHRLLYALSGGRPRDVYDYLDVRVDSISDEIAITPRNYTSLLNSLFFSAFLSHEHSNEILAYLSRAEDADILRSVVPDSIPVAQKFGVREVDGRHPNEFFSRCGIFYVPDRPYALCVMVEGDKASATAQTREISRLVYEYVSSR